MKIRFIVFLCLTLLTTALLVGFVIMFRYPTQTQVSHRSPGPVTPSEHLVSVNVDASFVPQEVSGGGGITYYLLETAPKDGSLSLFCPMSLDSLAKDRPGPQSYHVEYWEIEWHYTDVLGRDQVLADQELTKVSQGGIVLYDESICRVHHAMMKRQTVPIFYGLPDFKYSKQRNLEFRYGNGVVAGSCCVDPARHESRAWVCSECLKVEAAWSQRTADSR